VSQKLTDIAKTAMIVSSMKIGPVEI